MSNRFEFTTCCGDKLNHDVKDVYCVCKSKEMIVSVEVIQPNNNMQRWVVVDEYEDLIKQLEQ